MLREEKNNLDLKKLCSQFYNAIKYGRSKHNNVMIVGESNCGKTFLLEPLNEVFKTFNIPASSMFWLVQRRILQGHIFKRFSLGEPFSAQQRGYYNVGRATQTPRG